MTEEPDGPVVEWPDFWAEVRRLEDERPPQRLSDGPVVEWPDFWAEVQRLEDERRKQKGK